VFPNFSTSKNPRPGMEEVRWSSKLGGPELGGPVFGGPELLNEKLDVFLRAAKILNECCLGAAEKNDMAAAGVLPNSSGLGLDVSVGCEIPPEFAFLGDPTATIEGD